MSILLKVNLPEPEVKKITLLTPSGVEWNLTEKKDRGVFLREGGISGLVGTPSPLVSQAVGAVGQRFFGAEHGPLEGTLSLTIYDMSGDCTKIFDEFMGSLSTHVPAVLKVSSKLRGPRFGAVRLAAEIGSPACDPAEVSSLDVEASVVIDDGAWWSNWLHGNNNVTVTNNGDVPVSPKIRWKGAGGKIKLPSGATFTLPAVSQPRNLLLGIAQCLAVVDDQGELDRETWIKVRGQALPENIPPGASRVFSVPDGAELLWQVGFLSMWR
ncbi:hypothetical protein [Corynebacterium ulcerans]|uniref:hypothetical protein n=1 Tax=Corynebacterium ulcerans TaxID=65058 RepID=UPI0003C788B0|nr:hypothetical protein [Corynebacterium ulcerans]AIT89154.1 Hypothetical protein Cul210932_1208 [Corynebacterium ulcerans]ESU57542.1 hypothetical protein D881_07015 [Corynebacterium ulcerans NCTC 12077]SQG58782.1 Uncharacterised protein [Corynebacterium ulcerans]